MPSIRFTLRQLEIFAVVVRTGQVKRASDALHLSQAAVSQALRELADALELTLFERRGRGIVPTADARRLMYLIEAPMATFEDLAEQLEGSASKPHALVGEIRLAASSTITRYILPRALAILHRDNPELAVRVLSGNSAQVEARVANLEADTGFIEGPAQRGDLAVTPWGTDTLQIIAPHDYVAADIHIDALDAHAWVFREPGSGTRAVFEQTLALRGITAPRASLVIDDSGAIVRAVANGAGLACVSRLAARHANSDAPAVQFIDIEGLSLGRPLWCIERGTQGSTPFMARFRQALDAALAV